MDIYHDVSGRQYSPQASTEQKIAEALEAQKDFAGGQTYLSNALQSMHYQGKQNLDKIVYLPDVIEILEAKARLERHWGFCERHKVYGCVG